MVMEFWTKSKGKSEKLKVGRLLGFVKVFGPKLRTLSFVCSLKLAACSLFNKRQYKFNFEFGTVAEFFYRYKRAGCLSENLADLAQQLLRSLKRITRDPHDVLCMNHTPGWYLIIRIRHNRFFYNERIVLVLRQP